MFADVSVKIVEPGVIPGSLVSLYKSEDGTNWVLGDMVKLVESNSTVRYPTNTFSDFAVEERS